MDGGLADGRHRLDAARAGGLDAERSLIGGGAALGSPLRSVRWGRVVLDPVVDLARELGAAQLAEQPQAHVDAGRHARGRHDLAVVHPALAGQHLAGVASRARGCRSAVWYVVTRLPAVTPASASRNEPVQTLVVHWWCGRPRRSTARSRGPGAGALAAGTTITSGRPASARVRSASTRRPFAQGSARGLGDREDSKSDPRSGDAGNLPRAGEVELLDVLEEQDGDGRHRAPMLADARAAAARAARRPRPCALAGEPRGRSLQADDRGQAAGVEHGRGDGVQVGLALAGRDRVAVAAHGLELGRELLRVGDRGGVRRGSGSSSASCRAGRTRASPCRRRCSAGSRAGRPRDGDHAGAAGDEVGGDRVVVAGSERCGLAGLRHQLLEQRPRDLAHVEAREHALGELDHARPEPVAARRGRRARVAGRGQRREQRDTVEALIPVARASSFVPRSRPAAPSASSTAVARVTAARWRVAGLPVRGKIDDLSGRDYAGSGHSDTSLPPRQYVGARLGHRRPPPCARRRPSLPAGGDPDGLVDARPRSGPAGDRRPAHRGDAVPCLLRVPRRRPRPDGAVGVLRALCVARRRDRDGAGRGPRRLGGRAPRAGVHHPERRVRSAHAGVRGVRGGEVPVDRVGAADREGRERARRRRPARRGAARLLRARRRVPAHQRLAGGGRDRERAAAPRDRAPGRTLEGLFALAGAISAAETLEAAAARGHRARRAAARRHRLRDLPARGRTASACGCAPRRRARTRRA